MAFLILAVEFFLSLFSPALFLVVYCFVGADEDAFGFVNYASLSFKYYSIVMHCLLLIAVFSSIIRNKKVHNSIVKLSYFYALFMVLSVFFGFFVNGFGGNVLYRSIYALTTYGPSIFIVAYFNIRNGGLTFKKIKTIIFALFILSFLVVYSEKIGLSFLNVFNGVNYIDIDDSLYYQYRGTASVGDFYNAFLHKGTFLATGQFHNANALGFLSGLVVSISLFLILFSQEKRKKRIIMFPIRLIFIVLGMFMWCNAGTRAAIFALLSTLLCFVFFSNIKASKKVFFAIVFVSSVVALMLLYGDTIYSYLFGSAASDSYASRSTLNKNAFIYIANHFLFGSGGEDSLLNSAGVDPHILPLKIFTLYGLMPALLIMIIVYFRPVLFFFKNKRATNFNRCLFITIFSSLFFISITNNMTLRCIFWILVAFCYSLVHSLKNKRIDVCEGIVYE